jgi:hypothetical protein
MPCRVRKSELVYEYASLSWISFGLIDPLTSLDHIQNLSKGPLPFGGSGRPVLVGAQLGMAKADAAKPLPQNFERRRPTVLAKEKSWRWREQRVPPPIKHDASDVAPCVEPRFAE